VKCIKEPKIERLINERLIARSGNAIRLINPKLALGILPNGTKFAAGRQDLIVLWAAKKMAEFKREKGIAAG
jgi:hypothetical protein